jgi:aryl-alcohol dehydrogenase-like predicted oxidoreductase
LKSTAERAGRSLISLAFSWLLHHTACDVVILGASRLEQLRQNLEACADGPLSQEVVSECERIWQEFRGPIPNYNR